LLSSRKRGHFQVEIAKLIGVNKSTVSRELRRNHGWRGYRPNQAHRLALERRVNHINGIENFWNQGKRQMRKFNGIPKQHFYYFLKECEWRFNCPSPKQQLSMLKQWVTEDNA